ncbi:AraC family transcriptional regulator [Roseateles amylovorans]|uniref:AraC family transcriptional regulator n=1 Tax=Roseateles amylovorans TaxID=2978473 RepID=A0ABY6B1T9_9BURK|nr:AraC family transcriptional regulator [Roseateles amylovorans]UXH79030.1 AraC family transcriptional regulator [Roseateles amylovorans]
MSDVLDRLILSLDRHAPRDGVWSTAFPRLWTIRMGSPGVELIHAMQPAALCLVVQGAKEIQLGDERLSYDASQFMVFTTDLPVAGRVFQASPERPYLCLRLDFDPAEIADLLVQLGPPRAAPSGNAHAVAGHANEISRGLFLSPVTDAMLDATARLLDLLDHPQDQATLGPMAMRELVYRVLRSEQGERLAQVARSDSQTQRIHRAIRWLKQHYAQPLRIEALAREAHMSTSSLHQHFRALTAMSPLQYQKQLRLQEARRLLIAEGLEVARAGHAVGYESPSQFSREYSRLFGAPPSRDAIRRRDGEAVRLPA